MLEKIKLDYDFDVFLKAEVVYLTKYTNSQIYTNRMGDFQIVTAKLIQR